MERYALQDWVGHPRRFVDGWKQANKWVYFLLIIFDAWHELRALLQLPNDEGVVVCSLGCHRAEQGNKRHKEWSDITALVAPIMY